MEKQRRKNPEKAKSIHACSTLAEEKQKRKSLLIGNECLINSKNHSTK